MELAMTAPPGRSWYLITYDVSEDRRRVRVARCLEGHGERVQYSVFRVHLSRRALAALRVELERHLGETDGLLIVPLCATCAGRVLVRGGARDWNEERPARFRIVGGGVKHPAA
jgi:CRISPR-associated protein Cas2